MSLPVPLAVRLQTSKADRHITRDLRDLTYRSTIPGGFASARLSLHRPLNMQPDEIDYYADVTIYDRLTGEVEWEGWLEDPARQVSSDGQVWDLSAIGSAGHARDRTVPYIMADRDLSSLLRVNNVDPGAQTTIGDDPGAAAGSGSPALVLQFPAGTSITASSSVSMRYGRIWQAGQKLARVDFQWDAGRTDANLLLVAACRTNGGGFVGDIARSHAFNTGGGGFSPTVVGTNWTNGRNTLDLLIDSNTTVISTVNDYWASIRDLVILAMRLNADGTEKTTGYTTNTVLASEVVADLLGRLLTRYDGANAAITATTYDIEQLAYPDGITPAKVLDDLMLFEPDHYWAAWERDPTSGKYRFEWTPWSSDVRYDASIRDGFDSPASAAGLYNRVMVRYRDSSGVILNQVVQATVTALDNAGVIRQALIDLGDEVGSASAATRAGEQFLQQHKTPPNAGRLTISRPIYDAIRGRMVPPWKIRPGGLIRGRGVEPHIDSLNPPARDGATVFRVVGTEFNAATASATLELDSTPLSVAASLADLRATAGRRRR